MNRGNQVRVSMHFSVTQIYALLRFDWMTVTAVGLRIDQIDGVWKVIIPQTPGCQVFAFIPPASHMPQELNRICPRLQGPPGLKGEQGDTVVIDYDGRILDALKVSPAPRPCRFLQVNGKGLETQLSSGTVTSWHRLCPCPTSPSRGLGLGAELAGREELIASGG